MVAFSAAIGSGSYQFSGTGHMALAFQSAWASSAGWHRALALVRPSFGEVLYAGAVLSNTEQLSPRCRTASRRGRVPPAASTMGASCPPRTSVQLQSTSAQTPGKTEEHQSPESKTSQQDSESREICKTSIPGSNPGGASKTLENRAICSSRARALALELDLSGLQALPRCTGVSRKWLIRDAPAVRS
jgi:hypothetical protein